MHADASANERLALYRTAQRLVVEDAAWLQLALAIHAPGGEVSGAPAAPRTPSSSSRQLALHESQVGSGSRCTMIRGTPG